MRARPLRQRGVALVLVIWLAALVMVAASSFILGARTDTMVVRNSIAMARAEAIADAGVHRAAYEMHRHDRGSADRWNSDGAPHTWRFDDALVKIEVRDESARIDLNTAPDALLLSLLVSVGLEDEEAQALRDAILDWRDIDKLRRLHGAEASEYESAGLAWRPANSNFQAVEELQLVLGMRPEIYRRLFPLVTVHSRTLGVSLAGASREVLLAIPGVTAEQVDDFIARRNAAILENQPLPIFTQAAQYQSPPNSVVVTIRSEARLPDGVTFAREAVLLVRAYPKRPALFLSWRTVAAADDVVAMTTPAEVH